MLGQAGHFRMAAPEKIPYAIERYTNEAKRLLPRVLDKQLHGKDYIAEKYSIADMMSYPWTLASNLAGDPARRIPQCRRVGRQRWLRRPAVAARHGTAGRQTASPTGADGREDPRNPLWQETVRETLSTQMKLLRYGLHGPGKTRPALTPTERDPRPVRRSSPTSTPETLAEAMRCPPDRRDRPGEPCRKCPATRGWARRSANPGAFLAIGLNYSDHAAEVGAKIPREPILFMKGTHCIVGPNDDIRIPRGSAKDRLGGRARRRDRQVSEICRRSGCTESCRRLLHDQRRIGASIPDRRHRPVGEGQGLRYVRTDRTRGWSRRTKMPDPQNLDLWLEVDGKRYQHLAIPAQ